MSSRVVSCVARRACVCVNVRLARSLSKQETRARRLDRREGYKVFRQDTCTRVGLSASTPSARSSRRCSAPGTVAEDSTPVRPASREREPLARARPLFLFRARQSRSRENARAPRGRESIGAHFERRTERGSFGRARPLSRDARHTARKKIRAEVRPPSLSLSQDALSPKRERERERDPRFALCVRKAVRINLCVDVAAPI